MKNSTFRIYAADDNPQYLELLRSRLQMDFAEVRCFQHYEPLLAALDQRPNIVVVDHRFGDEEMGLELLEQIKSRDVSIHVILISGQQDVDVAVKALQSGASDYLEKNGEELDALEDSIARIKDFETATQSRFPAFRGFWRKVESWGQAALGIMLLMMMAVGCTPSRQAAHQVPVGLSKHFPHQISPDDKVSISIWNNDDKSVGSVFGIYNSNEVYGKWLLVNEFGEAAIPMLGNVKLAGKTTTEAADLLRAEYGKEVRDPVVIVRVLNREVTVTGEVNQPGNFILDKEKYTLAEVLGKAEGLTDYARLKDVTLTRQWRGKTKVYAMDLRKMSGEDLSSIYIRRGDVIHIPERSGKHLERKMPLLIPLASIVTSIGVLISVTRKTN